jgi:hypothetical protein
MHTVSNVVFLFSPLSLFAAPWRTTATVVELKLDAGLLPEAGAAGEGGGAGAGGGPHREPQHSAGSGPLKRAGGFAYSCLFTVSQR